MTALRDFEHALNCRCVDCVPRLTPSRRRSSSSQALPSIARMLDVGPTPCRVCQSAMVPRPGICDGCVRSARAATRAEALEFARSTVPDGLRSRTLESCEPFVHPDAYRKVRSLVGRKDFPSRLALHGPHNAGKTSLAVGILRRVHDLAASPDTTESRHERGRFAYWIDAGAMMRELASVRWVESASPLFQRAMKARFLVLDEAQDGGKASASVIKERFNRRDFITIITSWQDHDEAAKTPTLGGGYARRAYETAIACPVWGGS